mmetsp:Transcript_39261/g.78632  ORF Transcript_39261/g.78632 Transcript_39261/m.78632 type:complete len:311 (-) Transcript_39261:679-1611(-)
MSIRLWHWISLMTTRCTLQQSRPRRSHPAWAGPRNQETHTWRWTGTLSNIIYRAMASKWWNCSHPSAKLLRRRSCSGQRFSHVKMQNMISNRQIAGVSQRQSSRVFVAETTRSAAMKAEIHGRSGLRWRLVWPRLEAKGQGSKCNTTWKDMSLEVKDIAEEGHEFFSHFYLEPCMGRQVDVSRGSGPPAACSNLRWRDCEVNSFWKTDENSFMTLVTALLVSLSWHLLRIIHFSRASRELHWNPSPQIFIATSIVFVGASLDSASMFGGQWKLGVGFMHSVNCGELCLPEEPCTWTARSVSAYLCNAGID